MENEKIVSPWNMAENFIDLWDFTKLSWILLTITLVWFIYIISTRAVHKRNASWKEFLLWMISIVGWSFLMYMIMWDMMNKEAVTAITLLLLATLFSCLGFVLFFRAFKDPEKKEWVSRIVSGVIFAVIVFGVLVFMGSAQQELGLAGLMGGLLGSFISLAWHNFINMVRYKPSETVQDNDDDWTPPNI